MKKIFLTNLLLLFILLPTLSWAGSTFTSLALTNDKSVFLGVRVKEGEMEALSHLEKFDAVKSTSMQKIALPKELMTREVVALIPSKDHSLVVVTQETNEGGDKPRLHRFNLKNNTWKKITELDCPSFSQIKLDQKQITFSCHAPKDNGQTEVADKIVALKDFSPLEKGEYPFSSSRHEKDKLKIQLKGIPHEWDEVKISIGGKDQVFLPQK